MSVVYCLFINLLIRSEADGAISFGNYKLDTKSKLPDFEHCGDTYKVKTFNEITKLEKNGSFVYESVPGTAVNDFKATERTSLPPILVAIVPASLSLILISYDVPSSRPNVIFASSLPSTINDTLVSVALKSLTAVPGTDSYTKEPFFQLNLMVRSLLK